MGYFILIGLFALGALVACALAMLGVFDSVTQTPDQFGRLTGETVRERRTLPVVAGTLGVFGVLFFTITLLSAYEQVEAGHVGVVRTFGSITGQIGEGANWIAPWQQVQHEDVRVRKAEFRNPRQGVADDAKIALGRIDAASFETQDVYFEVVLNYSIEQGAVQELFRSVGPEWFAILVPNRVQQVFKAEVVQYSAVVATQKREEIRETVTARLQTELAPYGVHVHSVQIENIGYREEFSRAIELKQVATQDALRAEEKIRQSEAEARQNVATAKGLADAAIEAARGEAAAITVRATAQAEANRAVAASLTPALVQYTALDKIKGVSIALVPADGTTIIDPTGILRGIAP